METRCKKGGNLGNPVLPISHASPENAETADTRPPSQEPESPSSPAPPGAPERNSDTAAALPITIRQFAAKHSAWTEGSLRYLKFMSVPRVTSKGVISGNGFAAAFVKCGRRVLISERAFHEILEAMRIAGTVSSVAVDQGSKQESQTTQQRKDRHGE